MLFTRLEGRSIREREFFQLLQTIVLLTLAPFIVYTCREINRDRYVVRVLHGSQGCEQLELICIAIYAEALAEVLLECLKHARVIYFMKTSHHPRIYRRKLFGIHMPSWVLPFEQTPWGVDVLKWRGALRTVTIALVVSGVVCLPSFVINHYTHSYGIHRALLVGSLFLVVSIGSGGNVLIGAMYLLERAHILEMNKIEHREFKVAILSLYGVWLACSVFTTCRRYYMYFSQDPMLRSVSLLYFFPVGPEMIHAIESNRCGLLNMATPHLWLENKVGLGHIHVSESPVEETVVLQEITGLCSKQVGEIDPL